jgi:transposase-like protein
MPSVQRGGKSFPSVKKKNRRNVSSAVRQYLRDQAIDICFLKGRQGSMFIYWYSFIVRLSSVVMVF